MVDKLEFLETNKSKQKILLIGGSSVGWGLSADQIQKATKITTINLGHQAGFGLMDYQDFVISCLNPNDIVIFSPEWVFYKNPEFYDSATLYNLYLNEKYLRLTKKSTFTFIKTYFLREFSHSKRNRDPNNPYVYSCLNKNGDVISHCGKNPRGPIMYTVDFSNYDPELFRSRYKYLSKAKSFLLFPPTQKSIYEKNKKSFEQLQNIISKSNLLYLDSITSNVYDKTDFFDAEYHLKCEIRNLRTDKVIQSIINYTNSKKQ